MKPRLSEDDFERAAKALDVPVNVVKAVTEVESRGRGFISTGEPVILFERHIFSRETDGKYDRNHPDLSNRNPGGYGSSASQHWRLGRAAALDRDAALRSASWGLFQIMGFNFERAGHPTLQSFINAMYRSEGDQLDAFVEFVKADARMWEALKKKDWAGFAVRYNGPSYRKNRYDAKLRDAFRRLETS
jgi:hypothetical protein